MATETESKLSSWISNLLPTDESLKSYATLASLLGATGGALGMFDSTKPPVGYQGGIPTYTPVRRRVANTYDPTRRPGSGGQRYFTDTQFVSPDGVQGALDTAATQAQGLEALNLANPARQTRPITPPVISPTQPVTTGGVGTLPVIPTPESLVASPTTLAKGGGVKKYDLGGIVELIGQNPQIIDILAYLTAGTGLGGLGAVGLKKYREADKKEYNTGGMASSGRYLEGKSDGMADAVPAMIENEQPAALSDGEYVIAADVVSHLGNGNSDAGAKVLDEMSARIREARTGTTKQAPEINPKEFLPA
tara:strand:+ start:4601 stop:5521 length:921 start_codon:yes stop_codon:yes gene_type:complete